jgi:hypothetical protein
MALLNVRGVQGIGSKTKHINIVLRNAGYKDQEVYQNPVSKEGVRTWTAGPKLEMALRALNSL